MVSKRRAPETKDAEYVEEHYDVGVRDTAHVDAKVNYFDTVFFRSTAFTKEHGIKVDPDLYDRSRLILTNSYWIPPDERIIENGRDLIAEKIKAGKLNEKSYNETALPENHHFALDEFNGYENNTSVRVDALDREDDGIVFRCSKVSYFDQIATNIAAKERRKLGEYEIRRLDTTSSGRPKSFDRSMLANSLGIACLFFLDDEERAAIPRFRVPERKSGQSTIGMNGKWHCSSSGVFEAKDLSASFKPAESGEPETKEFPLTRVEEGMRREIQAESGFVDEEDYRLEAVCFTRELPRAGKPQLFFRAILNKEKYQTVEQVKETLEERHKDEGWEYHDDKLRSREFDQLVLALRRDWHVEYFGAMSYEGIANYKFCRF